MWTKVIHYGMVISSIYFEDFPSYTGVNKCMVLLEIFNPNRKENILWYGRVKFNSKDVFKAHDWGSKWK